MLNEQKMSHWNRLMKFSIAADLFLAHLEMAVERKQRLKHFVLLKSAVVHLLSSFGVRWGVAGVCAQQLTLLIKDLELQSVAYPLLQAPNKS